jgi:CHAD domain-containing protein
MRRLPAAACGAAIAAALARIEANAAGTLAGDPEALHQVRVGLRRLRSSLQAYRGLLPEKKRKRFGREVRKLVRPLGEARDLDVFGAWLEANAAPAAGVAASMKARRTEAQRDVQRTLSSKAWRRALADIGVLSGHAEAQVTPGLEFARDSIDRAHRKAMKHARRMDWSDDTDRHELRVKLKRLRYSCEFLGPLFPGRAAGDWLADLKRLQDLFGELNDVRVGRDLLDAIAPGERRLHGLLDERRAALLRRLGPAWRSLERRRPFWHSSARTPRRAATQAPALGTRVPRPSGRRPLRTPAGRRG